MLNRLELKLVRFFHGFFYFLLCMTGSVIFSLFCRIEIEGRRHIPKKGRFILAANHQNFYDGFLIAYVAGPFQRISFVIAKRALKAKSAQIFARLIGSVLLGNSIEDYQRVLKKLNKILSHGGRVGIFPEGDVSSRAIPRKFKGGVSKLSIDSRTKVIPVFLSGSYNLRYLKYWFSRPKILIRIGEPVPLYNYAERCGNNLDQIASVLRDKIVEIGNPSDIMQIDRIPTINTYTPILEEPVVKA